MNKKKTKEWTGQKNKKKPLKENKKLSGTDPSKDVSEEDGPDQGAAAPKKEKKWRAQPWKQKEPGVALLHFGQYASSFLL